MPESRTPGPNNPADERADERRPRRFPCAMDITIEWGAAELRGKVVDISAQGLFVELQNPLWIGARFAAHLELEKPVRVECVVRRVQPMRGMAATYSIFDEAQRQALATMMENLDRS